MAYDYQSRLDYVGERMKQLHPNNSGVYIRPGSNAIIIPSFTPEKLDITELAAYGLTLIQDKCMDVVFDTILLASLDPPEPKHSDTFITGETEYQVFSLNGDKSSGGIETQCFRYTTTSRLRVRVHIRQVS